MHKPLTSQLPSALRLRIAMPNITTPNSPKEGTLTCSTLNLSFHQFQYEFIFDQTSIHLLRSCLCFDSLSKKNYSALADLGCMRNQWVHKKKLKRRTLASIIFKLIEAAVEPSIAESIASVSVNAVKGDT